MVYRTNFAEHIINKLYHYGLKCIIIILLNYRRDVYFEIAPLKV